MGKRWARAFNDGALYSAEMAGGKVKGFSAASALGYTADNGVIRTTSGRFLLSNNSNLITVFPDTGTLAWTASGQKIIIGQSSFKIN